MHSNYSMKYILLLLIDGFMETTDDLCTCVTVSVWDFYCSFCNENYLVFVISVCVCVCECLYVSLCCMSLCVGPCVSVFE